MRRVAELRREGLEQWLRAERIKNKQLGPVRAPTGRITPWTLITVEWQTLNDALLRLPRRGGPKGITPPAQTERSDVSAHPTDPASGGRNRRFASAFLTVWSGETLGFTEHRGQE
jgi:hypothetical protein